MFYTKLQNVKVKNLKTVLWTICLLWVGFENVKADSVIDYPKKLPSAVKKNAVSVEDSFPDNLLANAAIKIFKYGELRDVDFLEKTLGRSIPLHIVYTKDYPSLLYAATFVDKTSIPGIHYFSPFVGADMDISGIPGRPPRGGVDGMVGT